jgi:hypothetical protein
MMMQQLRARRDALTAQRSSGVAGLQDRLTPLTPRRRTV